MRSSKRSLQDQDLLDIFKQIAEQKGTVRLFNSFKGLTIANVAYIIDISPGYVAFSIHEFQAVCIALEGKTYIEHASLPEILKAHAVTNDVVKKETVLTDFRGMGHFLGKRLSNRVQPREPVEVEIYVGEQCISGKLADLSPQGVGIYTFAAYIYGELPLQKNTTLLLNMKLPDLNGGLKLNGKVTSIIKQHGTLLHRFGIKTQPDPKAESILSSYVAQHSEEVLRELQNIYEALCSSSNTNP